MTDLLTFDPAGERARMHLAARGAPVVAVAFLGLFAGYLVLPDLALLGDVATILFGLGLAATAAGVGELTYHPAPRATSAVATVGVLAALALAAIGVLLLAGGSRAFLALEAYTFGVLGAWFVAWNVLAWRAGGLPLGVAGPGVAAGLAMLLGVAAGDPGAGGNMALAMVAGVVSVVGLPWWCLGVRRVLLREAGSPRGAEAGALVNA